MDFHKTASDDESDAGWDGRFLALDVPILSGSSKWQAYVGPKFCSFVWYNPRANWTDFVLCPSGVACTRRQTDKFHDP